MPLPSTPSPPQRPQSQLLSPFQSKPRLSAVSLAGEMCPRHCHIEQNVTLPVARLRGTLQGRAPPPRPLGLSEGGAESCWGMKKEGLREWPYFRGIWQKLPQSTFLCPYWPKVAAREAGVQAYSVGVLPVGGVGVTSAPARPPSWWPCDSLSRPPAERIRCSRNWGVHLRGGQQVWLEPGLGKVSSGLTPRWVGPCSRCGHFSPGWGTPAASSWSQLPAGPAQWKESWAGSAGPARELGVPAG